MIEARWQQRRFAEGFLSEAVDEFWDDWMWAVDRVLDDEDLVTTVYDACARGVPRAARAAGWAVTAGGGEK